MKEKLSKHEKEVNRYKEVCKSHVFGASGACEFRLAGEACGIHFEHGDFQMVSDREMLEAQGHLLSALCEDMEEIFIALNIANLARENTRARAFDLQALAEKYVCEEEQESEKRKAKKAAKDSPCCQ